MFFYKLNPAKWSLSKKIISILLLILLIPISSVSLLKEMEKTLAKNTTDNLLLSTRIIGNQLLANKHWFEESLLPDSKKYLGKEFFVFPINQHFQLDGYLSDWDAFSQHREPFIKGTEGLSILLGSYQRHLAVSVQVKDDFVIYPSQDKSFVSDQIEIEFKLQNSDYHRIILAPQASGNFPVRRFQSGKLKIDWRYKATWVETSDGFDLELQFPSGFKPKEIRFIHHDIDLENSIKHQKQISSSRFDFNPIVWPSNNLVNYFNEIDLPQAQRIWILDTRGRVLASAGRLDSQGVSYSSNPFLNWILSSQSDIEIDPRKGNLHLDSEEIYRALKGEESTRIENIKGSGLSIALAAFPIKVNYQIYGVLLLEENIAKVQILQRKTLLNLFFIVFVILLLVGWAIFWYVSRMVNRIKYLNSAIDASVDSHGRMTEPLNLEVETGDEIDELYQSVSHMGSRLFEYNDHLEKLASRLSHELRTPIAIVRSSLDNLLLNCKTEEDKEFIQRALDGNQRLGEIISRMRQASGVKEAMQTADKETIDLEDFIGQLIKGYQVSFEQHKFAFDSKLDDKDHMISVDLFSEMLDKLISNAMEFCDPSQPIEIKLVQAKNEFRLTVSNHGPMIAKKNLKRIFHSLVSIRTNEQSTGKNLGLGLYVVRLIAEFHNAQVRAQNKEDQTGVVFSLRWRND